MWQGLSLQKEASTSEAQSGLLRNACILPSTHLHQLWCALYLQSRRLNIHVRVMYSVSVLKPGRSQSSQPLYHTDLRGLCCLFRQSTEPLRDLCLLFMLAGGPLLSLLTCSSEMRATAHASMAMSKGATGLGVLLWTLLLLLPLFPLRPSPLPILAALLLLSLGQPFPPPPLLLLLLLSLLLCCVPLPFSGIKSSSRACTALAHSGGGVMRSWASAYSITARSPHDQQALWQRCQGCRCCPPRRWVRWLVWLGVEGMAVGRFP